MVDVRAIPDLASFIREYVLTTPDTQPYTGSKSFQPTSADLNVAVDAGKDVASGTSFLAAVMGNVISTGAMTKTGNYIAGVIGAYSVPGAVNTHYPAAGVLSLIMDGAGKGNGVVAAVDGDSGVVLGDAAFKVKCQNSTAGSGFDFGLDLQDAAHDGFLAVDKTFYKKAPVRLPSDVVVLVGAGAPSDGVTADNIAGKGSLYVDTTNGKLYINGGTITDSVWKIVTSA